MLHFNILCSIYTVYSIHVMVDDVCFIFHGQLFMQSLVCTVLVWLLQADILRVDKMMTKMIEYALVLHFLGFYSHILEYNVLGVLPARLPSSPHQLGDCLNAVVDGLSTRQLTDHAWHLVSPHIATSGSEIWNRKINTVAGQNSKKHHTWNCDKTLVKKICTVYRIKLSDALQKYQHFTFSIKV